MHLSNRVFLAEDAEDAEAQSFFSAPLRELALAHKHSAFPSRFSLTDRQVSSLITRATGSIPARCEVSLLRSEQALLKMKVSDSLRSPPRKPNPEL